MLGLLYFPVILVIVIYHTTNESYFVPPTQITLKTNYMA